MGRGEGSTEPEHLRAADGRLQPSAVMESGIPVADGRVKTPEGNLEMIVVVEPNYVALHFHRVAGRLGVKRQFAEVRDFARKSGSQMKIELAEIEAAVGALLVRRKKIHVSKAANLE